jgi:hypothetical protein
VLHLRLARPEALYGVLAALHASGRVPAALSFDGHDLLLDVDPQVAARLRRRIDVLSVDVVTQVVAEVSPPRPLAGTADRSR